MRVIYGEGEGKRKKRQEKDWAGKVLRPMLIGPCESEREEPREEPSLGEESLRGGTGLTGSPTHRGAGGKTAP